MTKPMLDGLVGYSYPLAEAVGGDGRRFVRRWIVRCVRDPSEQDLQALTVRVAAAVETVFRSGYTEHASEEALLESMPAVRLAAISPRHCVVEIELPTPDHAVGDAAGIGTWTTLRALDEAIGIEDLAGLPKQMWFQLG